MVVVAGTDNELYKDDLYKMWNVRPLEIFAGTEPTLIGTELYSRKGLVFFPDACFYEFILEDDLIKEKEDPSYVVPTYFMDEVEELCDRICILQNGLSIFYGTVQEAIHKTKSEKLETAYLLLTEKEELYDDNL